MRMSMAKKIFGIIILLIVVAGIILGIGLYSINTITDSMGRVIRQANRTNAMNAVNITALTRRSAMDAIIRVTDPKAMADLAKQVQATEAEMENQLAFYKANWSTPPAQSQIEADRDIRSVWNNYVQVTQEAINLTMENTNTEALAINDGMVGLWDEVDKELDALADFITQNSETFIQTVPVIREIRVKIMRFRGTVLRVIYETEIEKANNYATILEDTMKEVDTDLNSVLQQVKPNEGGALATQLLKKLQEQIAPKVAQIIGLGRRNSNALALAVMTERAVPLRTRLASLSGNLIDTGNRNMEQITETSRTMANRVFMLMLIVSIIGIVVSIVTAWIVVKAIISRLNQTIAGLGESSEQVNSAAGQISDSSQGLAEGSTEQAASLEETSSALEQMASMTRQNADNATKTNDTMIHTGKLFEEGVKQMTAMNEAMGTISESSDQISRIIKTIEDIAFQTNLLALNAAVEAARAGEAGKGLAVVADEVRNLAQRSAQAARDTTQLIQTTIERVRHGTEVAHNLDESFKGIQESATTVTRLTAEISSATNEQAQGVDQVNTAVAQMDKVTQSNAAAAEQAASAAEELSAQAGALKGMVEDLVSMVEGRVVEGGSNPRLGNSNKKVVKVKRLESSHDYSSKPAGVKMLPASEVIPLDESDDF